MGSSIQNQITLNSRRSAVIGRRYHKRYGISDKDRLFNASLLHVWQVQS
jgi:hypothetical protein